MSAHHIYSLTTHPALLTPATDGASWWKKESWMGNDDPCSGAGVAWWYGVYCSNGEVVTLDLWANDLGGTLPTEFGLLTSLTSGGGEDGVGEGGGGWSGVYNGFLMDNDMTGTIPTQIGQMTAFAEGLVMSLNLCSGKLPTQLGHFTGLTSFFDFSTQLLSGAIPTQLGRMTNIESWFDLQSNRFTRAIPTQLGRFTKLTRGFKLNNNLICGEVPTEVQALSNDVTIQHWAVEMGNDIGTVSKCTTAREHTMRASPPSTPPHLSTDH